MSRKIFFSYSWKDAIVAMRLYEDLIRSHLLVWRDQINGKPSVDFVDEFNAKIDECDDFLILDSSNYRHVSNWSLFEIKRFFENRECKKNRRIIVCLLEEPGAWRMQFNNTEHENFFSRINNLKYFKFYHEGIYDNQNIHQKSMEMICSLYDERYVPWDFVPEIKDLEDEINHSRATTLTNDDRNNILLGYQYIYRLIRLNRNVKDHFKLWVDDCDSYQLKLFFPRFAMCSWLASEQRWYDECYCQFNQLVKDFPDDPRCYRGIGAMASRIAHGIEDKMSSIIGNDSQKVSLMVELKEKRSESISAYKKTVEQLKKTDFEWQRQHTLVEVLVDLSIAFSNDNDYAQALNPLYEAYDIMWRGDRLDVRLIEQLLLCMEAFSNLEQCEKMLLPLIEKYPLENELYLHVGRLYVKRLEYEKAHGYFDKAYALNPMIKNGFYLLDCEKRMTNGHIAQPVQDFALSLLDRDNLTKEDSLWKAAICHYLLADDIKAHRYCPNYDFEDFPY